MSHAAPNMQLSADTAIACYEPSTGRKRRDVPAVTPDGVREAVARARAAQPVWAATPLAQRRKVLGTVLDIVLRDADALVELLADTAGKTREQALLGEIWPVCEKLRATVQHAARHLRPERVSAGLLMHKRATIHYEPLGVIGVIAPWNYPLQNVLAPTVPALVAGNAVVVKVSEWAADSAARIAAIFDEALRSHGLPTELVQVVVGYGDAGDALVRSGVDKVIFTGSMQNGRKVLAASADTLTPVILELGGKDALIVCDDANLEQAAHAALAGAFITAGQSCLAAERIVVFDAVYERFRDRVVELAQELRQGVSRPGAPTDVGAMTSPRQLEVVLELVEDAVASGARVLVGGSRGDGDGWYFLPTVLEGVTPQMRIAQEETFGPVIALMRVRDEDEAVRVTNGTQFGLGCTIISKNAGRAARLAQRVRVGNVSVNDFGMTYMAQELPFGGAKGSGFGRLNGREGLRACCHTKAVLKDRFPVSFPTKLFPVAPTDYARFRAVIQLVYGRGVASKARALRGLVRTTLS